MMRNIEPQISKEGEVVNESNFCLRCRAQIDCATGVNEDRHGPTPGSLSVCLYCGNVAAFTEGLFLREVTREEFSELPLEVRVKIEKIQVAAKFVFFPGGLRD